MRDSHTRVTDSQRTLAGGCARVSGTLQTNSFTARRCEIDVAAFWNEPLRIEKKGARAGRSRRETPGPFFVVPW